MESRKSTFKETWLNLHENTFKPTILEERWSYSQTKLLSLHSDANFQAAKPESWNRQIISEIISLHQKHILSPLTERYKTEAPRHAGMVGLDRGDEKRN